MNNITRPKLQLKTKAAPTPTPVPGEQRQAVKLEIKQKLFEQYTALAQTKGYKDNVTKCMADCLQYHIINIQNQERKKAKHEANRLANIARKAASEKASDTRSPATSA